MKAFSAFLSLALCAPALAGAPVGPEKVFNDAGFVDVGEGKNLFYWLFESRNDPATDPVLLWMSGGPGCSSQLAMFAENGPYIVQDDLSLTLNEYSWNANATVIWIDQPVGTGFSYGGVPVHNEDMVGADVYAFLSTLLFDRYEGKYSSQEFHVFGESYAGHYVPAVSRAIVRANKDAENKINLAGIAIGNGLTDPGEQYKWYVPYSREHDLVEASALKVMTGILELCEPLIDKCNGDITLDDDSIAPILEWSACLESYTFCNIGLTVPVTSTGVNPYDVRRPCGKEQLCYDFSNIDAYLALDDVREALGIPKNKKWAECNHVVDIVMVYGGDWMKDFEGHVTEVLESGVRALIYAGEYDFICNWMGNNAWTQTLQWSGATNFVGATNTTWTNSAGEEVGSYKTAEGLTFLKVKNAGHMVPMDQPKNALEMVQRHLFGKW